MNFDLTNEQRLLADTVARFVAGRYDFHSREACMREPGGFSREIWAEMAELGLLGLPFSERDGGFGGGGIETMLVMEALGRGLVVEPYLSSIVLCGTVLKLAADDAQKQARLPGLIQGAYLMALAHVETAVPRATIRGIHASARRAASGWRLDGTKTAVLDGGSADELVVSALTDSSPGGPSLFLVNPRASGVTLRGRSSYDGHQVADVVLDGVEVADGAVLGPVGGGEAVLRRAFETANAALAAEAVGVMADTLDTTVDYLKTRRQFGVPIGSFQALQHRCVDMLIQVELARSMAVLAALSLDLPDARERARNIAAAKIQIGRAGRFVGQQAVQLHGAIGMTAEYKVGHAFKRLTAIDTLFGDADHHLDMLAECGGLG